MRLPHSRRSMKPGLDPLSSSLATCRIARVAPCSRNGLWTNYHKKTDVWSRTCGSICQHTGACSSTLMSLKKRKKSCDKERVGMRPYSAVRTWTTVNHGC